MRVASGAFAGISYAPGIIASPQNDMAIRFLRLQWYTMCVLHNLREHWPWSTICGPASELSLPLMFLLR
jgi:hypothetical protein